MTVEINETPTFEPENEPSLTFRGEEIATADLEADQGYLSVRFLCDAFGLDRRAQRWAR